jgi:hypothetical protein
MLKSVRAAYCHQGQVAGISLRFRFAVELKEREVSYEREFDNSYRRRLPSRSCHATQKGFTNGAYHAARRSGVGSDFVGGSIQDAGT